MITKEQFLIEHNKLSPKKLQATMSMVTRFKEEKKPLLKDNCWSIDKLRLPFIAWLLASSVEKEKKGGVGRRPKEIYKNYPETHYES